MELAGPRGENVPRAAAGGPVARLDAAGFAGGASSLGALEPVDRRPRGPDHSPVAERTFTPDEANAALGSVRPLVERMVEAKQMLDAAEEQRDEVVRHISGNGGGIHPSELATLHRQVDEAVLELGNALDAVRELGVVVKDLDSGLVDFPSIRDGHPVLLCWRLGEDEVAFWHGLEDGFAGRQPI